MLMPGAAMPSFGARSEHKPRNNYFLSIGTIYSCHILTLMSCIVFSLSGDYPVLLEPWFLMTQQGHSLIQLKGSKVKKETFIQELYGKE
jgi:hypothetical protein